MEDNQTRDVGAAATAHEQEVRINIQCSDKTIQGFPSLVTLRTQSGCGGGATELHSFQPGGFSSLLHSLFLTNSQVDAEIEVAGENEKECNS